jgi:predicted Zn-dependent protease
MIRFAALDCVMRDLLKTPVAAVCCAAMLVTSQPVFAQGLAKKPTLIRDTEIEALVRDYAVPIFRAAGVNTSGTRIILISDKSFNAFVADGKSIYVNIGVLTEAATPNEVIGVIAHETGHLAGGHLARLRQEISTAQILSVAGMLAGTAAVIGAANSGGRVGNTSEGAIGAITGGPEMARRSLLAYQRGEELTADRAAVRYLTATQQSAAGMLTTFNRFAEQSLFTASRVDPYTVSHPLPRERIAQLEELARQSPHFERKDTPVLQARHDMMRAKIIGFIEGADSVNRRYPAHDGALPARYARAISAFKSGRLADALPLMAALLREYPNSAAFHELQGQMLLESGRANQAVPALQRAVSIAPAAPLIRAMLGQAYLASGNLDDAIRELTIASQREADNGEPYQYLSRAYAQKGDIAMAELSAAQYAFHTGDFVTARTQASRALAKLPKGSGPFNKAEDIFNHEPTRP